MDVLPEGHESFVANSPAIGLRSPESDWYFCFDLPAFIGQFFCPLGGVFRRNIDEEKSLSLVAIQPG